MKWSMLISSSKLPEGIMFFLLLISGLVLVSCGNSSKQEGEIVHADSWQANWIKAKSNQDTVNSWTCFRKEIELDQVPSSLTARIAVDSKYWLWINGEMVVFEGQLKRGPTPNDTYYDEVEIASQLEKGKNSISILVWHFGKEGFTHKSSGQAAMIFEANGKGINILSDKTWKAWRHSAFGHTGPPHPNFRLPESNILFDARKGDFSFSETEYDASKHPIAIEVGVPPTAPWNQLVKRPIPQWVISGFRNYVEPKNFPFVSEGDTIVCQLPYNAQVTPYFKIQAEAGDTIDIRTDHYFGGGPPGLRDQYITKSGTQEFECLGWINGHKVHYYIPQGIKVLDLKYRESGYDTEFAGSFECDDEFFNQLWKKAVRTLYITMRDNYMDCPDRERAQWWGDLVLESEEAFYALSRSSDALTRKGMFELMNWQREDGTIYSPIPSGNWDQELPGQMLISVGYYGFWTYYMHSGDLEVIDSVHNKVKKYLEVWGTLPNGTVEVRQGKWTWGDWGKNKDIPLLWNTQYYLALKGYRNMSEALGKNDEVEQTEKKMAALKTAFNKEYWRGDHYRSNTYDGATDDRSQALAVVSGLADEDKYEAIYQVLQKEWHASPYMEKYVAEALLQMGYTDFALDRLKKRFVPMVNHPEITTLWEGWGIGAEGYGGGTINHAWSGGGLTLLAQYIAGIYPTEAGYDRFRVKPQLGPLKYIKIKTPSAKGDIEVEIKKEDSFNLFVEVPEDTEASIHIPKDYGIIIMNGSRVFAQNKFLGHQELKATFMDDHSRIFDVGPGKYEFKAR